MTEENSARSGLTVAIIGAAAVIIAAVIGAYATLSSSPSPVVDGQGIPPLSPIAGSNGKGRPTAFPNGMAGTWTGSVVQYDISQRYDVTINLHDASVGSLVGTSRYESLRCKGDLRLRGVDGVRVVVTEYITENTGYPGCVKQVSLSLHLNEDGTLTYQVLIDDTDFAKVNGEGTLSRSQER